MSDEPNFEEALNITGNIISIEFTMSLVSGRKLDSNVGGEPMIFQTGADEMLPALEEILIDMKPGEETSVTLTPDRAYGPVKDEEFREFPLNSIPEEARDVGRKIMCRAPDGTERMVDVTEIRGDKVVLDFNHELAGQSLRFDLKVLSNETLKQ